MACEIKIALAVAPCAAACARLATEYQELEQECIEITEKWMDKLEEANKRGRLLGDAYAYQVGLLGRETERRYAAEARIEELKQVALGLQGAYFAQQDELKALRQHKAAFESLLEISERGTQSVPPATG